MDYKVFIENLLKSQGLEGWTVKINGRLTRTLGRCSHTRKTIELSRSHVEVDKQEIVIDTIRHEVAHAVVGPGHGHDNVWKAAASKLGATPTATTKGTDRLAKAKWVCVIKDTNEVVSTWVRKPAKNTFATISTRYIPSRKEETLGRLAILSADDYKRKS